MYRQLYCTVQYCNSSQRLFSTRRSQPTGIQNPFQLWKEAPCTSYFQKDCMQKYIIRTVPKPKYKSWYRNLKMLTYQRWASQPNLKSANHKFGNSWALSAIANLQFLRCASPQIENPQISTKYCTTLSQNSPKSRTFKRFFITSTYSFK